MYLIFSSDVFCIGAQIHTHTSFLHIHPHSLNAKLNNVVCVCFSIFKYYVHFITLFFEVHFYHVNVIYHPLWTLDLPLIFAILNIVNTPMGIFSLNKFAISSGSLDKFY